MNDYTRLARRSFLCFSSVFTFGISTTASGQAREPSQRSSDRPVTPNAAGAVPQSNDAISRSLSLLPGAALEKRKIATRNEDQALSVLGKPSTGDPTDPITIRDLVIDSSSTDKRGGHGIQVFPSSNTDISVSRISINSSGYGILTNSSSSIAPSRAMRIMDFTIYAGNDAIELNTPKVSQQNTVIWGGHVKATPAPGVTTSGFALGIAHQKGFVAGGFISLESRNEGIHIEDGSSLGVISAVVLRNTGSEGVRHYRGGRSSQSSGPVVFNGFSIEKHPAVPSPNSSGFYCVLDEGGSQGRSPIVAGVIADYETGLRLEGRAAFSVGYVSLERAKTAMRLTKGGHALSSTVFTDAAETLVLAKSGGAEVGSIHQEAVAPQVIIDSPEATSPSCIHEFSAPTLSTSPTSARAGEPLSVQLFQTPRLMCGRLKFRLNGTADIYWSADVFYDGKTIAITKILYDTTSDAIGIPENAEDVLRVSNKVFALQLETQKDVKISSMWVHFRGEYVR